MKIIVSSRLEPIFLDTLDETQGFLVDKYTRPDIDKYLRGKMGTKLEACRDPDEAEKLMLQIADRAVGVLLWVELVVYAFLRELQKTHFISKLRDKLQEIPKGLHELYQYILDRIKPLDRKVAFITMELVLRSHAVCQH
jgi:hypothetical protein